MKTTLKVISIAMIVVIALAIGGLRGTRMVHADSGFPEQITGSWMLTVNVPTQPASPQGMSFPAEMTFIPGGGLVSTRPGYLVIPPYGGALLENSGHGTWEQLGWREYAVTSIDMLQGGPGNTMFPDGAMFANEHLNFVARLSHDGKSFTGDWTGTFVDPNGTTLFGVYGTLTATRIQVEH